MQDAGTVCISLHSSKEWDLHPLELILGLDLACLHCAGLAHQVSAHQVLAYQVSALEKILFSSHYWVRCLVLVQIVDLALKSVLMVQDQLSGVPQKVTEL